MKKIFYSILIGMLALSFGCEEPDEVEYTVADGFLAQQSPFTVLDTEGSVSFMTENPDVSELTIEHLRTVNVVWSAEEGEAVLDTVESKGEIATVSISDKAGSMSFTRDDLGFADDAFATSWAEFSSTADIEGNPTNSFMVELQDPLVELKGPYIWTTNDDGDPISPEVDVYHNDAVQYIKYNFVRNAESLSDLTLYSKVGVNDDYTSVDTLDLNTDAINDDGEIIDSIEVVGTNYNYGDTAYFKFVPEGDFDALPSYLPSQNYEVKVPINKLAFGETGSFTFKTANPDAAWDLIHNKMIADTATYDSADVAVDFTEGTADLGIESGSRTEFVVPANEIDYTNIEEVIEEYDAGTPQQTVAGLEVDDVILYKTTYDGEDYYGSLVVDVANINTSQDSYELTLTYHNN